MTWGQHASVPKRIKDQVRRRDKVCQLGYAGCASRIEEFDHPQGLAERGLQRTPVRSAAEVQGVCRCCHAIKTKAQAQAGVQRAIDRRGGLSRRLRDRDAHPGTLT